MYLGITRSPTVVIAYIMRYGFDLHHPQTTSYQQAMDHVRSLRQSLDVVLFSPELRQLADQFAVLPAAPGALPNQCMPTNNRANCVTVIVQVCSHEALNQSLTTCSDLIR